MADQNTAGARYMAWLPPRPQRSACRTAITNIASRGRLLRDDHRHGVAEDADGLAARGKADDADLVGAGWGRRGERDYEARPGHHEPPAGAAETVGWIGRGPIRVGKFLIQAGVL